MTFAHQMLFQNPNSECKIDAKILFVRLNCMHHMQDHIFGLSHFFSVFSIVKILQKVHLEKENAIGNIL